MKIDSEKVLMVFTEADAEGMIDMMNEEREEGEPEIEELDGIEMNKVAKRMDYAVSTVNEILQMIVADIVDERT